MEVSQKTENRVRPQAVMKNKMSMSFDAISVNEAFARIAVAFIAPLNPTIEEISDIKTAVSEAVTNAIIHGYDEEFLREKPESIEKPVYLRCMLEEDVLLVEVQDQGKGIENIDKAMEPLFTTKPEMDRSGMGFAFMEAFMDDLEVISSPWHGTLIRMKKKIGITPWIRQEE